MTSGLFTGLADVIFINSIQCRPVTFDDGVWYAIDIVNPIILKNFKDNAFISVDRLDGLVQRFGEAAWDTFRLSIRETFPYQTTAGKTVYFGVCRTFTRKNNQSCFYLLERPLSGLLDKIHFRIRYSNNQYWSPETTTGNFYITISLCKAEKRPNNERGIRCVSGD